jgi:hypothetical protein
MSLLNELPTARVHTLDEDEHRASIAVLARTVDRVTAPTFAAGACELFRIGAVKQSTTTFADNDLRGANFYDVLRRKLNKTLGACVDVKRCERRSTVRDDQAAVHFRHLWWDALFGVAEFNVEMRSLNLHLWFQRREFVFDFLDAGINLCELDFQFLKPSFRGIDLFEQFQVRVFQPGIRLHICFDLLLENVELFIGIRLIQFGLEIFDMLFIGSKLQILLVRVFLETCNQRLLRGNLRLFPGDSFLTSSDATRTAFKLLVTRFKVQMYLVKFFETAGG